MKENKLLKNCSTAKVVKIDKNGAIFVRIPAINQLTQYKFEKSIHGVYRSVNKIEWHDENDNPILSHLMISPLFDPKVGQTYKILIDYVFKGGK